MISLSYEFKRLAREFLLTHLRYPKYKLFHEWPGRYELKKTRKQKGSRIGRSAFVFANGPSLGKLDSKKIAQLQKQGFDVFGLNTYVRTPFSKEVPPNFYLLSDPGYFGIIEVDATEERTRHIQSVQVDVKTVADLNVPVFIPLQFRDRSPFENYYCFNDYENFFGWNLEIDKPRCYTSMSAYKLLACACYLGYDAIYIAGYDNDYFRNISVDENNEIFYLDKHFYDDGVRRSVIPQTGQYVGDLFYEYFLVFHHLHYFKEHNILNLDPTSCVDAFKKTKELDVYL